MHMILVMYFGHDFGHDFGYDLFTFFGYDYVCRGLK
jgi:hypothetical protein